MGDDTTCQFMYEDGHPKIITSHTFFHSLTSEGSDNDGVTVTVEVWSRCVRWCAEQSQVQVDVGEKEQSFQVGLARQQKPPKVKRKLPFGLKMPTKRKKRGRLQSKSLRNEKGPRPRPRK